MTLIEHDHYPEIVENGQGVRRLELLGLEEQFRDPAQRRDFFARLSDEHFTEMAGYVNSITRGQKIDYDYADGKLTMGYTPPSGDKEPLMGLAFKTVREIASDTSLDDKTALRRAGLAIAGAINYIHPYDDGNGRTSRVLQYLVEFGTERGGKSFGEEVYALIGNLPVYNTDRHKAIENIPNPEIDRALDKHVEHENPNSYATLTGSERASARVAAFLDMMRGSIKVPVDEEVRRGHGLPKQRNVRIARINPGEIDAAKLYERDYLSQSSIPNRSPDDVPEGSHRVMAKRQSGTPVLMSLELID